MPSLEFDRLVPFHVPDIGGYSSPDLRRNLEYWTSLGGLQNKLVDIANVRYVVYPAQPTMLPSYGMVPFDPNHPLMLGSRGAIGGTETYKVDGVLAHRIQVIATLDRALDIPEHAIVAELTVAPNDGPAQTIHLRAGPDVAESAYDRPDVRGRVQHSKPSAIAFAQPDRFVLDGSPYQRLFYYSEHNLDGTINVDRIEVRYVFPEGGLEVFGIGLLELDAGTTKGITSEMRSKLSLVYQDEDVRIFENRDVFPRAYVVTGFRVTPDGIGPLSAMLDSPFDPRVEVMLTEPPPGAGPSVGSPVTVGEPSVGGTAVPTPAQATSIAPDRVVYQVVAPSGGGYFIHVANFLPGWKAFVDGRETPILLANALFRAVPLAAGDHIVELRYEPLSVELGLRLTLWALLLLLASFILSVTGIVRSRPNRLMTNGEGPR